MKVSRLIRVDSLEHMARESGYPVYFLDPWPTQFGAPDLFILDAPRIGWIAESATSSKESVSLQLQDDGAEDLGNEFYDTTMERLLDFNYPTWIELRALMQISNHPPMGPAPRPTEADGRVVITMQILSYRLVLETTKIGRNATIELARSIVPITK